LTAAKLRRAGLALALAGCATAPPQPVVVSDDDLDTARAIVERLSADSPPANDYQVSEIDVRNREVTLELVAETRGKAWQRTDRAMCRRCADEADWSCERDPASIQTQLPGRSWVSTSGLSTDDAQRAIRFLLKRPASDPALRKIPASRLHALDDLTAISDGRICVRYGPVTSFGHLVLKRRGSGFAVEDVIPPPNWAEGKTIAECGGAFEKLFDIRQALPSCASEPIDDRC